MQACRRARSIGDQIVDLSPCAVVSHTLPRGVRYPGSSGVGCDLPPHKVIDSVDSKSPCFMIWLSERVQVHARFSGP